MKLIIYSKDPECPECYSPEVEPVSDPDDDGFVEYHCSECGHYFVDNAPQLLETEYE